MIGRIDIRANAAHPNFPIPPVYMFAGAPSSPRVFGVPARMGSWAITAVKIVVAYPDNSTRTVSLTQVDGTWIGVIPACATTGAVQNGVQIVADGTDESGDAVTGYCLGVGDLFVMERDFTATADGTRYYFHYCEEVPTAPQVGDTAYTGGVLKWFDGTAWRDFGGGHDAAKLDGSAAYPAWEAGPYGEDSIVSHNGSLWKCVLATTVEPTEASEDWQLVTIQSLLAAKQNTLSSAQIAAVNSGATAEKVATWDGYAAQIAAKANASDVATALAQKASYADLPYALVTPGEWEFSGSGVQSGMVYHVEITSNGSGGHYYTLYIESLYLGQVTSPTDTLLIVHFDEVNITATRASLPGHLCDRAGNRVVVTGDTTLTLPALVNAGKLRDFLVRLEISGSTVPTITFAAPTGETIVYETDGDEFPVPDEAGTWSYSFTENCVAHKFAVALKKVNTVAAPQAQGGV